MPTPTHAMPMQTFDTTNEKTRFVQEDGVWLFADYQRFQFNAASVFQNVEAVGAPQAPAAKA